MGDGTLVILMIIGLFILWIFLGGPSRENVDKPFMKINTTQVQEAPFPANMEISR